MEILRWIQVIRLYNGDGNTSREGVVRGQITCRVVEVREDTGMVVFGWKEVRANRETQYLSLSGVVRPQDIQRQYDQFTSIRKPKTEFKGRGLFQISKVPDLEHVF